MLVAVRLKGEIKVRKEIKDTMKMLGLEKKLSFAILENREEIRGMLMKSQNFITWGEISEEMKNQIIGKKLKPPKGGFKSIKEMYPKGDLGYRGEKINELLKRMI